MPSVAFRVVTWRVPRRALSTRKGNKEEGTKMPEKLRKIAAETVAFADSADRKLVVEFAIPGAPADTVDVRLLEDSVHLSAPARDIEYVAWRTACTCQRQQGTSSMLRHGLWVGR
jgi:HSP20 family molecular chaperone IbpA